MLTTNNLQSNITIMITEIKTIALSKETAELFDCKKKLDECFNKLVEVQEKLFGHDKGFENSLGKAYTDMNNIIVRILSEQIDTNSTESGYKVI